MIRKLNKLRDGIDDLDQKIVALLNQRARIALKIGSLKNKNAGEPYVPAREQAVLRRIGKLGGGPLNAVALRAIYREIMSASLVLEGRVRVAYLGPPATFTHQAARLRFGSQVDYAPCETISDIFESVQKGQSNYGVVPIENSTEGAVTPTLDELMRTSLKICAEIYLPVAHHLMARGARGAIRRIVTHPQVFGQCRNWLRANMCGVEHIPAGSTARAAELAAADRHTAAIAGALAAELYGLKVLSSDIQDLSGNATRFLVIARSFGPPSGDDKTSLIFAIKHKVGALYHALQSFRKYKLNMTRIESRPNKQKAWEYLFFVDIEGHVGRLPVAQALRDLRKHCLLMTVLGSYPRAPEQMTEEQ